jgi:hypothetical protein
LSANLSSRQSGTIKIANIWDPNTTTSEGTALKDGRTAAMKKAATAADTDNDGILTRAELTKMDAKVQNLFNNNHTNQSPENVTFPVKA